MEIDFALIEQVRIAAGLDSLTIAQQERVERWAGAALAMVARRWPLSSLDQDVLAFVVSEVVSRMLLRPTDGASSRSVTVDDTRVERRFDTSAATLTIPDELWAMLAPQGARRRRGAMSAPLHFVSGYAR